AFLPVIVWTGVLRWGAVLAGVAVSVGLAVAAFRLMREPRRSLAWMIAYAIGNAASVVLFARVMGPFLVAPALISIITASLVTYPAFLRQPWILVTVMLAGLLAPFLLGLAGV